MNHRNYFEARIAFLREQYRDLYELYGIKLAEDMTEAEIYASEQSPPDPDEDATDLG